MLSVNNLSVGYRGLLAIQDVSMEVKRGEIVSLIGSNGAGKTTMLKTISETTSPFFIWNETSWMARSPL